MYELKCPNCAHVVRGPFVRVGAVVTCEACHKRYRVSNSLVTRRVRSGAPVVSGGADEAPADGHDPSTAVDPDLPRLDEDGNVIGLSGLSEMMKGQPRADKVPAAGQPEPMPKAARRKREAAEPSNPAEARHHAREAERHRRRRSMYLLLAVLVGAVAVLGGGLLLASRMAADAPPIAAGSAPAGGADPRVISNDLPLLHAQRLDLPQWAFIDEPFEDAHGDPDIQLTRESLATASDGRRAYLAHVVTDRRELVTDAQVVLSLVDLSRNEVARTQIGLTLLDANHPQDVRIPIAERFNDERLAPVARVEVRRRVGEAVFLGDGDLQLTPIGRGRQAAVRVTAFNPLDEPLNGLTFQFTALDRLERPIARWRARWDQPMAARQRIEFQALTPLPDDVTPHAWRIDAAGR